jgi:cytochrome P450
MGPSRSGGHSAVSVAIGFTTWILTEIDDVGQTVDIDPRRYAEAGMRDTHPVTQHHVLLTADEPAWWKGAR